MARTPLPDDPAALEQALAVLQDLGYGANVEMEFTISNGAMLRAVSAPPHLIADIEMRFPEPKPPMVDITADDGTVVRTEENPSDPAWRDEHKAWRETTERMRTRALLALAIEFVSVPEDVPGPDDEEWVALLRLAGVDVEIPEAGTRGRLLAWLLYFALRDVADLNRATNRALRMVGVPEGDVAQVASLFRDLQEWRADQRESTPTPPAD